MPLSDNGAQRFQNREFRGRLFTVLKEHSGGGVESCEDFSFISHSCLMPE
jgi:hypothetical protein